MDKNSNRHENQPGLFIFIDKNKEIEQNETIQFQLTPLQQIQSFAQLFSDSSNCSFIQF